MIEFKVKEVFVCDFCRNKCAGPCDELLQQIENGIVTDENKDLIGRKHRIKCLGRFCDKPCECQDVTQYADVDLTPFLEEIKFLGNKVNELLEKK